MTLTEEILIAGCGCTKETAGGAWLPALQVACDKYNIGTPERVSAFLAQVGVESAGLTRLVESLNYSAERLAVVWPYRFAVDPKAANKVPNATAYSLAGNPVSLANNVYANRLGNGGPETGDGWNYRGQGPIMITGRANVSECSKSTGIDFVSNPSLLQTPEGGAESAAWFFSSRDCNELADFGLIDKITEKVNGAPASDVNHGPLRRSRYQSCMAAFAAQ